MGWGREAVSEWASEGSFERREQGLPVGADGTPPVIHRGTYDGTCKRVDIPQGMSIWVVSQKFTLLSHIWGRSVLFYLAMSRAPKKIQAPGGMLAYRWVPEFF